MVIALNAVIPAQAGIPWAFGKIPAFAGMTELER
jgi:hypothetical protein